jgi:hypothetical protein
MKGIVKRNTFTIFPIRNIWFIGKSIEKKFPEKRTFIKIKQNTVYRCPLKFILPGA